MTKYTDETKATDQLYKDACDIVRQSGRTTITFLQRQLLVGYNRAARLLEAMEADGIVGPIKSDGVRDLLIKSEAQETQ